MKQTTLAYLGMQRYVIFLSTVFALSLCSARRASCEETIDIVDTYGLSKISQETVLKAASIRVGDPALKPKQIDELVRRLEAIPNVQQATVAVIHAPSSNNSADTPSQFIVYIGIREVGRPSLAFNPLPTAEVQLPDEIVKTNQEFERTMIASIRNGNFSEDDSEGHALMGDEVARAVQEQFIPLADRHFDKLVKVLQTAKRAEHRRVAAVVIGYASDKKSAATTLAVAIRDPDKVVRNNAMRALGVILNYAHARPDLSIEASVDPFLDFLESIDWTDRNKAVAALISATANRNERSLAMLRERSLPTLVEMARWKADGHAMMAFLLVGRIANMSDEEIIKAWQAGEREAIIERARNGQRPIELKIKR